MACDRNCLSTSKTRRKVQDMGQRIFPPLIIKIYHSSKDNTFLSNKMIDFTALRQHQAKAAVKPP
jgi:hypothetical protein